MGCNNSKNMTAPALSEANLGSEGSSAPGDEEEQFIKRRTWGSPAPPLPAIGQKIQIPDPEPSEDPILKSGGTAFYIEDENTIAKSVRPPRRLQSIRGSSKLTMDALIQKQKDHEEKRMRKLEETRRNARKACDLGLRNLQMKKRREIEWSKRIHDQSENRLNNASKKRQSTLEARKSKGRTRQLTRNAHKKAVLSDSVNDSLHLNVVDKLEHDSDYNKSESESWADNDSVKNIYDQMEFITPASGLAPSSRVTGNQSDDEFFS